MHRSEQGFTLVELLVVVTIIVVLLSLLVPALDQAIYQAELTVCGTKQHAVATGLIAYTTNNKRWYPPRPGNQFAAFNITPLRPILKPILGGFDAPMTCPLISAKPLPYEQSNNSILIGNYNLWFSFEYRTGDTGNPSPQAMRRLGQRINYFEDSFSVLVSDRDSVNQNLQEAYSSHPDRDGLMWAWFLIDEALPGLLQDVPASQTYVSAAWSLTNGWERGATDDNFTFDDGSVSRINGITWDEADLVHVPIQNNAARSPPNGWMFLPLR